MKLFIGLFAAVLAFNGVFAVPAGSPNDDAEVIEVPRANSNLPAGENDFKNFRGVIDTGAGYPFLQSEPHPFSFNLGFFDSFEDIFRRLRARLWPVELAGDSGDDDSSDGDGTVAFGLTPKGGNTTSTVKVVDGHKIEVNETVYGDSNNVFKVRVINIRPVDSEETDENESGYKPPVSATSAPESKSETESNESNERREPIDRKTANDNEINGNIDDPEHTTIENAMLPTMYDDDDANLNAAAFVTDNSLEQSQTESYNENIAAVAATNNPYDGNNMESADDITTIATDATTSIEDSERLTIENNEEAEVNDNLNEYVADAGIVATEGAVTEAEEMTKDLSALQLSAEAAYAGAESFNGEFGVDEVDRAVDAASTEAGHSEDEDAIEAEIDSSSVSHSNYAAPVVSKQREDASSSSDDEDEAAVEMNATFNSEWETLAEDLATVNDRDNELSNDIDVYESVPVDLSNDIAVNDVAAANPDFPINPDAEFVDVAGVLSPSSAGPKFEKLSLAAAMNPTSYQPAATVDSRNMK